MPARATTTSPGLLPMPMPGSPSASWAVYRARIGSLFRHADVPVVAAFWLFGLINNVLYVIILSAAQDLVGSSVPKGIVLLADVLPSFFTKLVAPYFIHRIPYSIRVLVFATLSSTGMLLIAFTPPTKSVATRLVGVVLASFSSGGGELSFLGLTHYYGHVSLAAWGSGTGGAGLIGAGLYVLLTDWLGLSVEASLLASACLPAFMLLSFFLILPRGPLRHGSSSSSSSKPNYLPIPNTDHTSIPDDSEPDPDDDNTASSLLAPTAPPYTSTPASSSSTTTTHSLSQNLVRARALFFPCMLPLLLVYIAEYTINQGVSPTLLFPLGSPFTSYRSFYPFYGFLYQLGVFISRSSTPWIRIRNLYLPSVLQIVNLVLLTAHALFYFIPSVYIVFAIILWEGLLGGAVYVNTFAQIMDTVPAEDREFSLGATSVSDSAGICIAGFLGMAMEVWLCDWQVQHGRDWCRRIESSS